MSNDLTVLMNSRPPVVARPKALGDLTAGVGGGFGVLTFRGKVWRMVRQGDETILMDDRGPMPSVELVIINGSSNLSRIWYAKKYSDGDDMAPDCWSIDGVKPDPGAPSKQSTTCAGCPKAVWGSEVGDDGKQRQACAVARRLAVCAAGDIANGVQVDPLLLRVPRSALQDLAAYAKRLAGVGYDYTMVVTRVGFDLQAPYPKLVFSAVRALTQEESERVSQAQLDDAVDRILTQAVEEKQSDDIASLNTTPAQVFEQPPAQPVAAVQQVVQMPPVQPAGPVVVAPAVLLQEAPAEPNPVATGTASVEKLRAAMSKFKSS